MELSPHSALRGAGRKPISKTGFRNALRGSVWVTEGQIHKHYAPFWIFGTSRAQKMAQIWLKMAFSEGLGIWCSQMAGSEWIKTGSSYRTT